MNSTKRRKFSKQERESIYKICNGHCAYCGCEIQIGEMQIDHKIPLYRGGKDEITNMLPTCRSCNHYKRTLTVEEYRGYISRIPNRLMRDSIPFQVGLRFGIVEAVEKPVRFYFEEGYDETNRKTEREP